MIRLRSFPGATPPSRGFTLIEVLVALTIAAVALMAATRAAGSLTQSMSDLRLRAVAQWSAENRLAQLRVMQDFPTVGRRSFDCSQGDVAMRCDEEVFATPNPSFRRVEVSVVALLPDGTSTNRLARLVGFATSLR